MTDTIRHRGPDAEGQYITGDGSQTSAGVALGHRRLSIIDVGGSVQPMGNEDGSIQIVFNGEIYNYCELRQQLAGSHKFQTDGDTEVIVHLYEEYGMDFVQHLRGMFALVIWDHHEQRLVLARDRAGQKPLFFRRDNTRFVFASELKSLLQIPGISRELDRNSVLAFLTLQYVPAPRSIFKGFRRLPPAHIATVQRGEYKEWSYWSPPYNQPDRGRPAIADWQDELRSELTEAVRLRLRSDVPLGAFLSGGVDSTVICGLMQSQLDQPVKTFSIGFPVKAFDERTYARQTAKMLKTDHHEAVVDPDALEMLPQLIWHYDEPFGDSSAIPTMYLSRMTREHVTVALTGDAGDELFCGYDRYRAVRIAGRLDVIPQPIRNLLSSTANILPSNVRQKSFRRRLRRLLETLSEQPERRYLNWISIFNREKLQELVSDDMWKLTESQDPAQHIFDSYRLCPDRDFVTRTTATDLVSYLPGDLLTKVDIASMSTGLECRSPMLDHKVMELAARMPLEVKQSQNRGKRVLIETFTDLIPSDIQTRKKMGFGVPIDHWFRNELRELLHDVLLSHKATERGLLRREVVRRLIEEHTTGVFDHAYRLWNLLCLELWQCMYLDALPPMSAPASL